MGVSPTLQIFSESSFAVPKVVGGMMRGLPKSGGGKAKTMSPGLPNAEAVVEPVQPCAGPTRSCVTA